MRAVLIHGMGRTALSMRLLAQRLMRHGITSRSFSYVSALESVDHMVARFTRFLAAEPDDDYVVIGHSLGGLLARSAIASLSGRSPQRLIQLGTPNSSPRLARRLQRNWLYRLVNGDAGQMLATPGRMAELPVTRIPVTVIAGTAGRRGRRSLLRDVQNDGIVGLDEAHLPGMELLTVDGYHTFLPFNRDVFALILARVQRPRVNL
jgi:surfactin synthase thioesterase subunit